MDEETEKQAGGKIGGNTRHIARCIDRCLRMNAMGNHLLIQVIQVIQVKMKKYAQSTRVKTRGRLKFTWITRIRLHNPQD